MIAEGARGTCAMIAEGARGTLHQDSINSTGDIILAVSELHCVIAELEDQSSELRERLGSVLAPQPTATSNVDDAAEKQEECSPLGADLRRLARRIDDVSLLLKSTRHELQV